MATALPRYLSSGSTPGLQTLHAARTSMHSAPLVAVSSSCCSLGSTSSLLPGGASRNLDTVVSKASASLHEYRQPDVCILSITVTKLYFCHVASDPHIHTTVNADLLRPFVQPSLCALRTGEHDYPLLGDPSRPIEVLLARRSGRGRPPRGGRPSYQYKVHFKNLDALYEPG